MEALRVSRTDNTHNPWEDECEESEDSITVSDVEKEVF